MGNENATLRKKETVKMKEDWNWRETRFCSAANYKQKNGLHSAAVPLFERNGS